MTIGDWFSSSSNVKQTPSSRDLSGRLNQLRTHYYRRPRLKYSHVVRGDAVGERCLTLGELFGRTAALKASARLAVAQAAARPGRPVPALPDDLADARLDIFDASWGALLQTIADGLPTDVFTTRPGIADVPLGDLLPWLHRAHGHIDAPELPPRLVRALHQSKTTTWRALATTRLLDIAQGPRIGPAPLAALLRAAFFAAAEAAVDSAASGVAPHIRLQRDRTDRSDHSDRPGAAAFPRSSRRRPTA